MANAASQLKEFLKQSEWLDRAAARSKEIEARLGPLTKCFGLMGIRVETESLEIDDGICWIRNVSNPPGMVHLFAAADLSIRDVYPISRYSGAISAEIAINDQGAEAPGLFDLGWHLAALLKIRGYHALCCPALSPVSWDVVAGKGKEGLKFRLLDDVPSSIQFAETSRVLTVADAEWVKRHLRAAYALREEGRSRRFTLALGIAYSWNHTKEVRVSITNIWAALEALFGDRADRYIRKSVARRIFEWTAAQDAGEIAELYNLRCDAVHGRNISEQELATALKNSVTLLDTALVKCVERNEVPLPDWRT
jgi:hypothetical protein